MPSESLGTTRWVVKITDFGESKAIERLGTDCGSRAYMAPEMMGFRQVQFYNELVDVWSLGVMFLEILTANNYFQDQEFRYKYCSGIGDLPVRKLDEQSITGDCRKLLKRMLEPDPEKRPSASECLLDPWIVPRTAGDEEKSRSDDTADDYLKRSDYIYQAYAYG